MFWILKNLISTDPQGHLSFNLEPKSTEYRVLVNEAGKILLDPITNIPIASSGCGKIPKH
jgi:hypothetical protein